MEWHYLDNAGVPRIGTVERTSDRGGTDITYFFRRDSGELDVLSGMRVKATAHANYGHKPGCPICESKATQLANDLAAQHNLTVEVTDAIRLADLEE